MSSGQLDPRRSSPWPILVVGLLAVLTAGVIFILPQLTQESPSSAALPVSGPSVTPSAGPASASAQRLQRERARSELTEQVQTLEEAERKLLAHGVRVWSAVAFGQASAQLAEGRGQLGEGRLETARAALAVAERELTEIAASAEQIFARSLEDTLRALEGDSLVEARKHLAPALAMEPERQEVQRLASRVEVLSAVLGVMDEARLAGLEGRFEEAVHRFKEATRLDSDSKRARKGLARAERDLVESRFQALLARVREQLAAGELDLASEALERARSRRTGAAEIAPLARALAEARKEERARKLLAQAEQLEGQERWSEALTSYGEALALNSQLEVALRGRARCSAWLELSGRLDAHVARPDRFIAPEVEAEARSLLAEARVRTGGGPLHAARVARLTELLSTAVQARRVMLRSDGSTVVVLQRVGELGRFRERTLELVPGSYTLTGRRSGYRDVRVQLRVEVGRDPAPLLVSCLEGLSSR